MTGCWPSRSYHNVFTHSVYDENRFQRFSSCTATVIDGEHSPGNRITLCNKRSTEWMPIGDQSFLACFGCCIQRVLIWGRYSWRFEKHCSGEKPSGRISWNKSESHSKEFNNLK